MTMRSQPSYSQAPAGPTSGTRAFVLSDQQTSNPHQPAPPRSSNRDPSTHPGNPRVLGEVDGDPYFMATVSQPRYSGHQDDWNERTRIIPPEVARAQVFGEDGGHPTSAGVPASRATANVRFDSSTIREQSDREAEWRRALASLSAQLEDTKDQLLSANESNKKLLSDRNMNLSINSALRKAFTDARTSVYGLRRALTSAHWERDEFEKSLLRLEDQATNVEAKQICSSAQNAWLARHNTDNFIASLPTVAAGA